MVATATPRPSTAPAAPSPSSTRASQVLAPIASVGRIALAVIDGTRKYKLYLVNPDGSGLTGIGDCMRQPDFRPDGQRIVVNGEGCGRDDLWSLKPDGSDLQKVTNFPLDQRPVWAVSRGTYHVAFDSTRATSGQSYIYVDDRQVSYGSGAILGQYVVVLPPESIVYSGCDYGFGSGSTCGMYRTSLWGGKPTSVSTNPGDIPTDADAAGDTVHAVCGSQLGHLFVFRRWPIGPAADGKPRQRRSSHLLARWQFHRVHIQPQR